MGVSVYYLLRQSKFFFQVLYLILQGWYSVILRHVEWQAVSVLHKARLVTSRSRGLLQATCEAQNLFSPTGTAEFELAGRAL